MLPDHAIAIKSIQDRDRLRDLRRVFKPLLTSYNWMMRLNLFEKFKPVHSSRKISTQFVEFIFAALPAMTAVTVVTVMISLGPGTARAQAQARCPTSKGKEDPVKLLLEAAAHAENTARLDQVRCVRLPVGGSVAIDWSKPISPSTVESAYRLTRLGPKAYRTEVNVNLIADSGERLTGQDLETLRGRIHWCLKKAGPNFLGPNGETLEIDLTSDPLVPISTIKVKRDAIRENSHTYAAHTNCQTVVHEILHLHGLVDEYREETTGVDVDPKTGQVVYRNDGGGAALAFNCRALGPPDSIMRNQWAAFEALKDCEIREFNSQTNPTRTCFPKDPASPSGPTRGGNEKSEPRDLIDGILDGAWKKVGEKKGRRSLLSPAHFNAITQPGCKDVNGLYYKCALNAYASSIDPRKDGTACWAVPPECQSPARWIGTAH